MGDKLGRYEILKPLARGDIAELLLARASGLDGFQSHVVIKRLREEFAEEESVVDAFVTEARLAATLHHQHIVQVFDIGQEGEAQYFAMEYVHGEEVRRLLAQAFESNQPIPLDHAVSIAMATATALHHAHEQKGSDDKPLSIVHRDVSPANILIGYDGNIKVVDFGIARASLRTAATQAGMLRGKAPYMSPEQCKGGKLDRRSAVFSLGIVLYELITCRRLFKASNEYLTMAAVVAGQVPRPSKYRPDLPPALEEIVMKALSPDPGMRFQTAQQMLEALDKVATDQSMRASSHALASYMKRVFGERGEPWTPTGTVSPQVDVDFDGKGTGLAPPPAEALKAKPLAKVTAKTSPLETARAQMVAAPAAPAAAVPSTPVQIPAGAPAAAETKVESKKIATTRAPVPPPKRQKQKTIQIPTSAQAAGAPPRADATPSKTTNGASDAPRPDATAAPAANGAAAADATTAPAANGATASPRTDATPVPAANGAIAAPSTEKPAAPSAEKPADKPAPSPFRVLSPTAFMRKDQAGSSKPDLVVAPAKAEVPEAPAPKVSPFAVLAGDLAAARRAETAPELPPPPKVSSSPALVLPLVAPSGTGEESAIQAPIVAPRRPTPSPLANPSKADESEDTSVDSGTSPGEDTRVDPTRDGFVTAVDAAEEAIVVAKRVDQPTAIVKPLPPPVVDPDIHGDGFAMDPDRSARKRKWLIGGGIAAALALALAIGMSGGNKTKEPAGPTEEENAAAIERKKAKLEADAAAARAAAEQPPPERTWASSQQAATEEPATPVETAPPAPSEPPPSEAFDSAMTADLVALAPAGATAAAMAIPIPEDPPEPPPAEPPPPQPKVAKPKTVATAKPATTARVATSKPTTSKPTTAKPTTAKVATTKPAATAKPVATAKPTTTAKVATTKPAATAKPVATTKPAATAKPTTAAAKKPPVKTTKKPGWDPNSLFPK